jgi:tRNA(fMet)-specific endonuclease VapC
MKAFDTDVLVEILAGNPAFVHRAAAIPVDEQAVPGVVVEEVVRARLNTIRQAEAGKGRLTIPLAYELFARTFIELRRLPILPYHENANKLFQDWRDRKIRVATHDLRIAAICVDMRATLVSRNRRDFDQVPGLDVEYW